MMTKTYAALLLAASLALTAPAAQAGKLKDLGKSLAYPVKKAAHNTGRTVKEGAGTASRGINHGAKAVEYPIRKTGENASRTAHKTTKK